MPSSSAVERVQSTGGLATCRAPGAQRIPLARADAEKILSCFAGLVYSKFCKQKFVASLLDS